MKKLFFLAVLVFSMEFTINAQDSCPPSNFGCVLVEEGDINFWIPMPETRVELHYKKYLCPDGSIAYDLQNIEAWGLGEAIYLGSEPLWPDCTGQSAYTPLRCEGGCN